MELTITSQKSTKLSVSLLRGSLHVDVDPSSIAPESLFGFAERRNPKRAFLFVSRVLGKHIPVKPRVMQASYEKLENRILRLAGDPTSLSNGVLWLRQSDGVGGQVILHGEKIAGDDLELRDVGLFFMDGRSQFTGRVEAQSAKLERGFWVVEQGQRFRLGEPAEPFDAMRLATGLTSRKIEDSLASPESMSFWELPGYVSLLEQSGFSAQRHRLQFNALLAKPLLFCAMVLVAASFSLRMQRRGGAIARGLETGGRWRSRNSRRACSCRDSSRWFRRSLRIRGTRRPPCGSRFA